MAESCPGVDLRQALLVTGMAYPRRNLLGGSGRTGQRASSAAVRPLVGRRHDLLVRRAAVQVPAAGPVWRPFQHQVRPEPGVHVLYPHLRPVRAVSHEGHQRHRCAMPPTCSTAYSTTNRTCALRSITPIPPASPTMCSRLMQLLGFRFAPRDPGPHRQEPVCPWRRQSLPDTVGADRRPDPGQTDPDALGRDPASGGFDQAGHSHCLADAAQAGQLSSPERSGGGAARTGADRTHAVHTGLAASTNCGDGSRSD